MDKGVFCLKQQWRKEWVFMNRYSKEGGNGKDYSLRPGWQRGKSSM